MQAAPKFPFLNLEKKNDFKTYLTLVSLQILVIFPNLTIRLPHSRINSQFLCSFVPKSAKPATVSVPLSGFQTSVRANKLLPG